MTDAPRRFVGGVLLMLGVLRAATADAATLDVVGLFADKAVVTVDGGVPHSVSVGEAIAGFKLVGVDATGATFVVDGRRQRIGGSGYLCSHPPARAGWRSRWSSTRTPQCLFGSDPSTNLGRCLSTKALSRTCAHGRWIRPPRIELSSAPAASDPAAKLVS